MICSVIGGTKKERATVTEALWFAKDYWLPRHRNLWVDVELLPASKMDGAQADCIGDDREYEIRIEKGLGNEDLVTAIFHEFVHIKQHVRNEFPTFDSCDIPYLERPWEIEAYNEQEIMLKKFQRQLTT